jgi:hypothetical protein
VGILILAAGWTAWRAKNATSQANEIASTVSKLRQDATRGDVEAVSKDIALLHEQAAALHATTDDPLWSIAATIPILGAKPKAARTLGAAADSMATAAAPLAEILPHFSASALRSSGGAIDVKSLGNLGPTLENLSTVSMRVAIDLGEIDSSAVNPAQVAQLTAARSELMTAAPTLHSISTAIPAITSLLGGRGPRTYFIGLENLAEARGNGGLIGAYAILNVNEGRIHLESAAPRKSLDADGPIIPVSNLPVEFRDLWGNDAREWAGLNLSRHYPYTGQLIMNGWKSYSGKNIDEAVLMDQRVVAALLAGTGPITIRGESIDSTNALDFLTKDIYSKFPIVADKDAVVVELVQGVFQRITSGHFSIAPMVRALQAPVHNGDLLMYSSHPDEQVVLSQFSLAGVLPDDPKPYSVVAVNNGSGNKMEAYVSVDVEYDGGSCVDGTRLSTLNVTLHNSAPTSGLPDYVVGRHDLTPEQAAKVPRSSTKELLYIYGPVRSLNALTTIDDSIVSPPEGLERNHPVWRVDVPINPGQTRTVSVQLQQIVDSQTPDTAMTLGSQPMAIPQKTNVIPGTECTSS